MTDPQRQRFEEWALDNKYATPTQLTYASDDYLNDDVQLMWEAYQAASSRLDDPEVVERVAQIIQHHDDNYGGAWFEQREAVKNDFRQTAKAALKALKESL